MDKKYFTLNHLNKTIQDFEYGEHEKSNVPRAIDKEWLIASQSGVYMNSHSYTMVLRSFHIQTTIIIEL